MVSFVHALAKANHERGFLLCGLDPVLEKMPSHLVDRWDFDKKHLIVCFLIPIIDAVAPYVAGFKPNLSFFIAFDDVQNCKFWGQEALWTICRYIRQKYPEHVLILDSKDGDIGDSNWGYFKRAFDGYDAHAMTWDPYLGPAMIDQLKRYPGRGIIALARTSNKDGTAFQTTVCEDKRPIYLHNVDQWVKLWKSRFQVGLVAGATHPDELETIRSTIGAMPLLIPGVGKQGGDLIEAAKRGQGGLSGNIMINQSSSYLYASGGTDFAEKAGEIAKRDQLSIEAEVL
jgi:orotidine-5'-phosphate decarboxylase